MKQHMRPHTPRRKPFSEAHQTQIAVAATVAIIAALVYVFGYLMPASKDQQQAQSQLTAKPKRSSPP